MIYLVDNHGVEEPGVNLALEEYCLRELDPHRMYLILYVNRPSVVVGRHQNILTETDPEFLHRRGIPALRRISGGGTVYHDRGNLNLAVIQDHTRRGLTQVSRALEPVRRTLARLSVATRFDERNNLLIGSGKISGNAQFSNTRRILIHATLLFDSDLRQLSHALQAEAGHIQSNAPRSIPSPVTNISDHLAAPLRRSSFCKRLRSAYADACGGMKTLHLAGRHWDAIDRLYRNKYRRWTWNWGKAPPFRVRHRGISARGPWEICLEVKNGCLAHVAFTGSLRREGFKPELEAVLGGVRFEPDAICKRLASIHCRGLLPPNYRPQSLADLLWRNRRFCADLAASAVSDAAPHSRR